MKTYTEEQCPIILYTNEAEKQATLAFRANGAWRTVGQDFSETSYPGAGVPTHRVVPMVYRNKYGGLTLHRLQDAEHRTHMAAGSRSIALVNEQVCWPGYDSVPSRWNGGFGADPCEVFPLGMIPPLQFPVITAGDDLGTDAEGPWRGSWAFFFSVLFEDEEGQLSRYPIPVPPSLAFSAHTGVGYFRIGTVGHCYKSITWSNIPDGPPGTRYKWLLRSTQVDTTLTGGGAVQPAIDDLQFCARIPQGRTTYVDVNGNDFSLHADPRLARIIEQQAAPPARYLGAFDGRITEACLRVHPGALFVAPWENGAVNAPIDDVLLYGDRSYFVAVTPEKMILRTMENGLPEDIEVLLATKTLRDVQYTPESGMVEGSPVQLSGCHLRVGYPNILTSSVYSLGEMESVVATILPGMRVEGLAGEFPENTYVLFRFGTRQSGGALWYIKITVTNNPLLNSDGATIQFYPSTPVEGTIYQARWAIGVYPGADPEESADNLLRTRVDSFCTFLSGEKTIQAGLSDSKYITPGMLVYLSGAYADGTVVESVDVSTGLLTVSSLAMRDNSGDLETVVFAYDTGDIGLAGEPGFIRTFGNAYPAALYWGIDYLDQFRPARYATTFTAASPGYAQDALDVWMAGNRRGGRAVFGALMGLAEVGPAELVFSARGRMRTSNVRTGSTHIDEDYTKQVVSWNRGACSPYAICEGNLWVIFASDIGICACDAGEGEHLISQALYNPGRKPGKRGQLEYAIEASVLAARNDSDDFKIFMQVLDSVLYVQYHSVPGLTRPDKEIRYDFSAGVGRTGLAEVLRPDGSPYPWSAPLTIGPSCSCIFSDAAGVYRLGALDTNAGAADGRVDVLDVGTMDNGTLIQPRWFTGIRVTRSPIQRQILRARGLTRKAETGLSVGIGTAPERGALVSDWDDVSIPPSGADDYERFTEDFPKGARLDREAEQYRICDDGSGECPEVTDISLDTERQPDIGVKRG